MNWTIEIVPLSAMANTMRQKKRGSHVFYDKLKKRKSFMENGNDKESDFDWDIKLKWSTSITHNQATFFAISGLGYYLNWQ